MPQYYLKINADTLEQAAQTLAGDNDLKNWLTELKETETLHIINDTLDQRVQDAKSDLKDTLIDLLIDNPDITSTDALDDKPCYITDKINEMADSNTPVYTSEIEDVFFMNKNELVEAYDNAGIYGKGERPNNYEMVCVCIYLEDQLHSYYNEELTDLIKSYLEIRDAGELNNADGKLDTTKAEAKIKELFA